MLPYWHGAAIEFCFRPADSVSASAAVAAKANDCFTNDTASTDADWYWLEEDRLQQTPAEQRLLDDQTMEEEATRIARFEALDLGTFSTAWGDFLSMDSENHQGFQSGTHYGNQNKSTQPVAPETVWRTDFSMGDCKLMMSTPPPPPMPPTAAMSASGPVDDSKSKKSNVSCGATASVGFGQLQTLQSCASAQSNNSNVNNGGGGSQAVASGRSLLEIEQAVLHTRNNSNQQQRYEMRGGHSVEICSRVEFPDRLTRDVSVTVEATHSNGCHRVTMLKGLTAKKRPDLGPKVKDCRLRMDQIVMTRPNVTSEDWQKSITMSYDSDFQVGLGEDRATRPL